MSQISEQEQLNKNEYTYWRALYFASKDENAAIKVENAKLRKNLEKQEQISKQQQISKQEQINQDTISDENAELRKTLEKQSKEIERCKNVVYQLVGGLYNENTQRGTSSRHVKQLFGYNNEQELEDEKDSWTIWPTTRQGDDNEKRIKKLEETIKNLEERFEIMEQKSDIHIGRDECNYPISDIGYQILSNAIVSNAI